MMTAPSVNIHASCVLLAEAAKAFGAAAETGVLLLGDSGTGKSDLALCLMERGALLVADDRCELFLSSGTLYARPPATLAGLIEVRGVGVVACPHAPQARIGLVARLVGGDAVPRLPSPTRYSPPPALSMPEALWPPLLALAAFEASAPAKIVAAAAAHARALFRETINPR